MSPSTPKKLAEAKMFDEELQDYIQLIAAQHSLVISQIIPDMLSPEILEHLLFENMETREHMIGTNQMRKEMDFDIILNCCKQRTLFKQMMATLRNNSSRIMTSGSERSEDLELNENDNRASELERPLSEFDATAIIN